MAPPWNVVFFGTSSFAIPTLESLIQGPEDIVAGVTQPDRRKGRGQKISLSPVKEVALHHGITVLQPEKVSEEALVEEIRRIQPDLFVVAAYGQILPKSLLSIPRYGAVNVHASLLPHYRGAAPIVWAILNGEKVTGVTTMMMDEGMDTGDILLQAEVSVGERETAESLNNRLAVLGAHLLQETLRGMKTGTLHPTPQDPDKASYAPSIKKEDGAIDWSKEAREIDRQVRALYPWPGAFTRWRGKSLKICRGEVRHVQPRGRSGSVVWVGGDFLEVETGRDSFLVREVQLEGGRRMGIRDFLSGHPVPVGTTFE
jgi:methionyl-tRNA formyltransferase